MSRNRPTIERECEVLTRYLVGHQPGPYVVEKYVEAHRITDSYSDAGGFGRMLTRIARTHPSLARSADAYARLFAPRSLLRRKLVLLLAILETSAPTYALLDRVDAVSKPRLVLRLAARTTGSVLALLAGTLLLLPMQLVFGLLGGED